MKKYLIINKNKYFNNKFKNTKKKKFFFINKKKDLNLKKLSKIQPNLIFFPHWSHIIKEKVLKKYNCIGFHSTPLPYGRGGSPIQNMIKRGFSKTKICAFKMEANIDGGPIYIKTELSLNGNASNIMDRMYVLIYEMIIKLSDSTPKSKKQTGRVVTFKRLTKKDSEIKMRKKLNLKSLYNLIRMLDAKDYNYPNAYIRLKNFDIRFTDAKITKNKLIAKATFSKSKI